MGIKHMFKSTHFRNLSIIFILALFIVNLAEAGSKRRRGTAGAQELLIPVGARNIAMSGAFVAGLSGVEAAAYNPAGVAGMMSNGQAMFSRNNWIADINVNYAAVASNFGGKNFFGVTFRNIDFGDIMVTTAEEPDGTGETFSPNYVTIGFLFSRKMTDRILFGADIKFVHEGIMRESANGFVIDAGVQYTTGTNGIRLGATVKNLGLNMWFNGPDLEGMYQPEGSEPGSSNEPRRVHSQDYEMPTSLELGVSYGPVNLGIGNVTLATSFLNNNFSFDEYRLGGEFIFMNMLYLRGGFVIAFDPEPFGADNIEGTDDDEEDEQWIYDSEKFLFGPSFGFGLNSEKVTGMDLTIDYAYRSAKWFEGAQWITISLGF